MLAALDRRYVHFLRLKAGSGRTEGYRMCSNEKIEDLRQRDLIVYENARYENLYAIDRPALDVMLQIVRMQLRGAIEVLQGRGGAVDAQ